MNEFSCSISFDAVNLSQHFNQQTPANLWRPLVEAYGTEFLLNYHAQNMSSYFVNTAVNFAPNLLATVQSANNLYGGNYGGLENYPQREQRV